MMKHWSPSQGHTPVLLSESLRGLAVQPGGRYIDCTLGAGGHAAAILDHSAPGGQLLGLDADPNAIEMARERLQHDAPLDMRFDPNQKTTAADIVNTTSEERLAHLIKMYGEEGRARQIAREIVRFRPLRTTRELANIIEKAVGRRGKIHPATKTFQALRIAVNHELEHLESALRQAVELLGYEGRLVVITYHSLEDRIVKQFMQKEASSCICPPETPACVCGHTARLRLINKKVITPSPKEIELNPRSRSAKLRVAERIVTQGNSYATSEDHAFLTIAKSRGWRRPALLHKIRMAFLAA